MIGRALTILLCLAVVGPAAAQVTQLRSGQHESFSRLTVEMPQRLKWTIEPGERNATIRFEATDLQIDTSVVFDRIPRDRISAVTWNGAGNALQLSFGCECEVSGFWHGASLLVLDVRQRSENAAVTKPAPKTQKPDAGLAFDTRPPTRAADLVTTELFGPRVAQADESAAVAKTSQRANTLDDTRDRLLKQLARAATQGLIEPHASMADQLVGSDTMKKPEPQKAALPQEPAHSNLPQINLKAESSIDRDFLSTNPTGAMANGANGCLPPGQVDVGSWGSGAPFGQQVSALRLELTGEFDELKTETALKLARLYLFFGFGAEARETLALHPWTSLEAAVLLQLAEIAEYGHAKEPTYLANQMDCTTSAALWSALSYEKLPRDLPIDTDAILRAFNGLPQHLRAHYGPSLSRRFLELGQDDVAKKLLRILDRPDLPSTPQAEMAKAQVNASDGQTQKADARLKQVVESNAEPSAEALVNMINDRVERNEAISFEEAQLAGAYAFEKQNDPIGAELSAAHIRALASSGAFDMAFESLADRGDALRPDQMPTLHSDMVRLLTDHANDITFLHHMLAQRIDPASSLDPFAANQAAGRLIQLGFPDAAADLIMKDVPRSSSAFRERRLLRAEMALTMNKPRQAIVEVIDLDGADANLLRARALSDVGDHAAAYHLFASTKDADKARQEAWLEGNWQQAADPDEPAYAALANMIAANETDAASVSLANQAVLARNRALIDASSEARATLSAVLGANPVPGTTPASP